jgi:hypothetical protein
VFASRNLADGTEFVSAKVLRTKYIIQVGSAASKLKSDNILILVLAGHRDEAGSFDGETEVKLRKKAM